MSIVLLLKIMILMLFISLVFIVYFTIKSMKVSMKIQEQVIETYKNLCDKLNKINTFGEIKLIIIEIEEFNKLEDKVAKSKFNYLKIQLFSLFTAKVKTL